MRDLCAAQLSDRRALDSSSSCRARLFKSVGYMLHNAVDLGADLVVPESQNVVSRVAKKIGSALVVGQFVGVLRTIYFDNEPRLWTEEIDEEWTDGMLTAELESVELTASQS